MRVVSCKMLHVILLICLVRPCACPADPPKSQLKLQSEFQPVKPGATEDPEVAKLIQPYAEKLVALYEPIGVAAADFKNEKPEGTLGNLISDLLRGEAKRIFEKEADLCVLNSGGLRVPISKGKISRATIFELFPFENKVVLVELSGKEIRQVAQAIAEWGGMPISGMSLEITPDRKLLGAKIAGADLDENKVYTVITIDYLLQGNDELFQATTFDRSKKSGLLLRDVIIDYIRRQNSKPLVSEKDGRIKVITEHKLP